MYEAVHTVIVFKRKKYSDTAADGLSVNTMVPCWHQHANNRNKHTGNKGTKATATITATTPCDNKPMETCE